MNNLIKKLFNLNTGYFLNPHIYYYKGEQRVGYILCKGYSVLSIPGFERLSIFTDKLEAESVLLTFKQQEQ